MKLLIPKSLFEKIKEHCQSSLGKRPKKAFGLIFGIKSNDIWIAQKVIIDELKDISRNPDIWPEIEKAFENYGWPQCNCSREDMGFVIDSKSIKKAIDENRSMDLLAVFHLHPCEHRKDQSPEIPSPIDRLLHCDREGQVLCIIVHATSKEGFKSFRAFKILDSGTDLPNWEEVEVECV
jgi:hypothetical protein